MMRTCSASSRRRRDPNVLLRLHIGLLLLASISLTSMSIFASQVVLAQSSPSSSTEAAVTVPASGQVHTYLADVADGRSGPVSVPDDGHTRAGPPLRYRDNGDGTITDLNTELMWEKKCVGCGGLHDVHGRYRWSGEGTEQTIWDWLDRVNAEDETGLAGYSDWRVATVKELVSIVDYGEIDPAVDEAFHGISCRRECSDPKQPGCSCTHVGEYWTATTFSDFPAHALVVRFGLGFVDDRVKTNLHFVRAVRGGR